MVSPTVAIATATRAGVNRWITSVPSQAGPMPSTGVRMPGMAYPIPTISMVGKTSAKKTDPWSRLNNRASVRVSWPSPRGISARVAPVLGTGVVVALMPGPPSR